MTLSGSLRKPIKNRLPKSVKSTPVFGRDEDAGRYFRCRICGFPCDIKRDALDSGPAGVEYPVLEPDTTDPGYGAGSSLEGFRATGDGFEAGLPWGSDSPEGFIAPLAEDYRPVSGDELAVRLHPGGIHHSMTLMELDSSGNPKEIYVNRKPTVTSGCPFCGSHNWK